MILFRVLGFWCFMLRVIWNVCFIEFFVIVLVMVLGSWFEFVMIVLGVECLD